MRTRWADAIPARRDRRHGRGRIAVPGAGDRADARRPEERLRRFLAQSCATVLLVAAAPPRAAARAHRHDRCGSRGQSAASSTASASSSGTAVKETGRLTRTARAPPSRSTCSGRRDRVDRTGRSAASSRISAACRGRLAFRVVRFHTGHRSGQPRALARAAIKCSCCSARRSSGARRRRPRLSAPSRSPPEQFDNQEVTLIGRFRGRNCSATCRRGWRRASGISCCSRPTPSIWVTAYGPKARTSTSILGPRRHRQVARGERHGAARRCRGWLAAESDSSDDRPAEGPVEVAGPTIPAEPPPAVIFSAPLADDTEFPSTGRIRIQFSRDMNPAEFPRSRPHPLRRNNTSSRRAAHIHGNLQRRQPLD